jgi:hypothetical protein
MKIEKYILDIYKMKSEQEIIQIIDSMILEEIDKIFKEIKSDKSLTSRQKYDLSVRYFNYYKSKIV